jgi:hypothetical protein
MGTKRRGAALVTAVLMMGLLAAVVAALLVYVQHQRNRSIAAARAMVRESCAASGMQYARAYFARHQLQWGSYLAKPAGFSSSVPHPYNPVPSSWNTHPAVPLSPALKEAHPELFADLDGDGTSDVYIYVRDNADEGLPADEDWGRDNDQIVIVGAVCISPTMVPRRQDGSIDPLLVTVEGVLSYNITDSGYRSQALMGTSGTGNLN